MRFTCYAHAIAQKADSKGRQFIFCWLDGDEPPKDDPQQSKVPPNERLTPMPVPVQVIAPESEVKKPGDVGKLIVHKRWAAQAGLVEEDEVELGGIFR